MSFSAKRARELRRRQTQAEAIMWKELRKYRKIKFPFRRQHPVTLIEISNSTILYVLDFYCMPIKLAIEIDGPVHLQSEVIHYDKHRQSLLEEMGIMVVRFTNDEVYHNLEYVIKTIDDCIATRIKGLS